MTGIDPFNLVYDKLWSLVERNQELKSLIKQGNRIKFDGLTNQKYEISDADLPELALLVNGFNNFDTTSTSRSIKRNFSFSIATGEYKIQSFNKITFELFRSLIDYECELCALTWCECNFVDSARLIGADESILEDSERQISGWIGIWTFEVTMIFQHSMLKIKNPPIG